MSEDTIQSNACTIQKEKCVVVIEPCGVGWRAKYNGTSALGCTPGEAVDMLRLEATK